MVNYLLKKSYQLKNLQEIDFKDLWGDHGVFTTMWIYEKPSKILFFKDHINNLIKSTKAYSIYKPFLKKNILKLLKENLNSKTKYNHLLRIALNKKTLSISLRKRVEPNLNFDLRLVNLKRQRPEFKNLKYLEILKHLTKLDNSRNDIGLCSNNKIFETGTSNLLFIKNNKVYSPIKKFYKGITYKFFKSKIKNIIKKDINVNSLKEFDEIILIGSGKGVASVKTINQIKWKRKSLKFYNIFSRHYKSAISNCKRYSYLS
jgi:4-amino-4-deoxychorismate lyase